MNPVALGSKGLKKACGAKGSTVSMILTVVIAMVIEFCISSDNSGVIRVQVMVSEARQGLESSTCALSF